MGRVTTGTRRVIVVLSVVLLAGATTVSAGAATPSDAEVLEAALLTEADAPAGWVGIDAGPAGLEPGIDACAAFYKADAKAQEIAETGQSRIYADPAAPQVSNLSNVAYVFPSAKKAKRYVKAYTKGDDAPECIAAQAEAALSAQLLGPDAPTGLELTVEVADPTSPDLGDQAVAFEADITATLNGAPVQSASGSLVVVRTGDTVMEFQVIAPARPFDPAVDAAVETVVTRVEDL